MRPPTFLGLSLSGAYDLFIGLPVRAYDRYTGYSPGQEAWMMMQSPSPDLRRTSILELADHRYGRDPKLPYVSEAYVQRAGKDDSPLVRAAALRALNRSRYAKAAALYRFALNDPDALVRLEAAKALANIPDDAAIDLLVVHLLGDPIMDVRIACADALRNYKTLEVGK